MRDELLKSDDIEHAREVVTKRHQAPLAPHLLETADEKVAVTGAAFEGAKGVLCQFSSAAHLCFGIFHSRPVPFENGFMLPPLHGTRRCLGRQAAHAEWTGVAVAFAA